MEVKVLYSPGKGSWCSSLVPVGASGGGSPRHSLLARQALTLAALAAIPATHLFEGNTTRAAFRRDL
ncbi:MAG: hypothetical protein Q8O52_19160 [Sulfuritalea sp.]|nr:hypothetical protein [Sulfuritalea sp.]